MKENQAELEIDIKSLQKFKMFDKSDKKPLDVKDIIKKIYLEYFGIEILLLQNQKLFINKLQIVQDKNIDSLDLYQLGFQFKNQKVLSIKKHPSNQQLITILYEKNYIEIFDISFDLEDPIFQFNFNYNTNFKDQLLDFSYLDVQQNIVESLDQLCIFFCSQKNYYIFGPISLPCFDYREKSLQREVSYINMINQQNFQQTTEQLDLFIETYKKTNKTYNKNYNSTLQIKDLHQLLQENYKVTRKVYFMNVFTTAMAGRIFVKIQQGILEDDLNFIVQYSCGFQYLANIQNQILDICQLDLSKKQKNFKVDIEGEFVFILNGFELTRINIGFVKQLVNKSFQDIESADWQKLLNENLLVMDLKKEDCGVLDITIKDRDQIFLLYSKKDDQEVFIEQILITQIYNEQKENIKQKILGKLLQQDVIIPEINDIDLQQDFGDNLESFIQEIEKIKNKIDDNNFKLQESKMNEIFDKFLDYQEILEEAQEKQNEQMQNNIKNQIELKNCKEKLKRKQDKIDKQMDEFQEIYDQFNKQQKNLQQQYSELFQKFKNSKNFLQTPDNQQQEIYQKNKQLLKQNKMNQNFETLKNLVDQLKLNYEKKDDQQNLYLEDQYEKIHMQIKNTLKN